MIINILIKHESIDPNNLKSIENIMKDFNGYKISKICVGEIYLSKSIGETTMRALGSVTEEVETKEERLDRIADEMRRNGADERAIAHYWNWMASR